MVDPNASTSPRLEGYVYVSADDDGSMRSARPGRRVTIEGRRPPYIVVDHRIGSVTVARWPGRLWFVRIADALAAHDQPLPTAGYTRAVAVDVLREVPTSTLFGDHGEAVCAVIARASGLDLDLVNALALARHPEAGAAYSRAWRNWLGDTDPETRSMTGSFTSVLGVFPTGPHRSRSPIHSGLSILDRAVWDRAKLIEGPSAFGLDEDGTEHLTAIWAAANDALLEAVMAFAAPGISDSADRRIMSAAWCAVLGPAPRGSVPL